MNPSVAQFLGGGLGSPINFDPSKSYSPGGAREGGGPDTGAPLRRMVGAKDGDEREGLKAFGAAVADGGAFGAASSSPESTSGSADDGAKKVTIAPGDGQIVPYDPSAAPNATAGGC